MTNSYNDLGKILISIVVLTMPLDASAESRITEPYIMAFHSCENTEYDCSQTFGHRVHLAQSTAGDSWSQVPGFSSYEGSVPDAVHRRIKIDGKVFDKIYIYTPNELVRFKHKNGKQQAKVSVTISGGITSEGGGFVDPSGFVDGKGILWMAFLYCRTNGSPTTCFPESSEKTRYIGLAREIKGSDGRRFRFLKNLLDLSVEGYPSGTDPDLFTDGSKYYLYVSIGPSFQAWQADALKGPYTKVLAPTETIFSENNGGVPSAIFEKDQNLFWSFAHSSDQVSVIRRAVHAGFTSALTDSNFSTVITGQDLGLSPTTSVQSPGVSKF